MVAKVYELLHLVWKTYHFRPRSWRVLQSLGTELKCERNMAVFTSLVNLTCPSQAIKTEDLAKDSGLFVTTLQYADHLAAITTSAGRSRKINYLILFISIISYYKYYVYGQIIVKTIQLKFRILFLPAVWMKHGWDESLDYCAFGHVLADMFHELRRLQTNGPILPKATSELQRTVIALECMKLRPKRGGMFKRFIASCVQKEKESHISGLRGGNDGAVWYFDQKYIDI